MVILLKKATVICCLVEIMHWNKILFTHRWPAMYMYFYTTQQNTVSVLRLTLRSLLIKQRYVTILKLYATLLHFSIKIYRYFKNYLDFSILMDNYLVTYNFN
jgi:hypothetical protein